MRWTFAVVTDSNQCSIFFLSHFSAGIRLQDTSQPYVVLLLSLSHDACEAWPGSLVALPAAKSHPVPRFRHLVSFVAKYLEIYQSKFTMHIIPFSLEASLIHHHHHHQHHQSLNREGR